MTTGVGASKFLGVQKIFAQIFPDLPKTLSCNFVGRILVQPPKNGLHLFFKRWAPFLPRFEGILPKFSKILLDFSGNLPGFSTNQSIWECACSPCTPASYTTVNDGYNILLYSFSFIIDEHQNIQIVMLSYSTGLPSVAWQNCISYKKKSNNILQLQTTMSFKTKYFQSELCNKIFNASHVSLLFENHNSIDT